MINFLAKQVLDFPFFSLSVLLIMQSCGHFNPVSASFFDGLSFLKVVLRKSHLLKIKLVVINSSITLEMSHLMLKTCT